MDADHVRSQYVDRLAQHRSLGFDSTDSPTDHAESIYHSRMRIGPNQCVRKINPIFTDRDFGQILEIDLVANTDSRRDHAEAVKGLHTPFQEFITGAVALELHLHIQAQ